MNKPQPLSLIVNELRELIEKRTSTDFSVYYDDHTIYGDLQYIRSKVKTAWDKKTQENYKDSDYRVDSKDTIERPDLVAGELEFAIERCDKLLNKISRNSSDYYNLVPKILRFKEIIKCHRNAAENDEIFY